MTKYEPKLKFYVQIVQTPLEIEDFMPIVDETVSLEFNVFDTNFFPEFNSIFRYVGSSTSRWPDLLWTKVKYLLNTIALWRWFTLSDRLIAIESLM